MITVATCQYQLEPLANWHDYAKKIEGILIEAKNRNAHLLLLPEYAGTEIAGYHPTDKELYAALTPLLSRYIKFYQDMAHRYQLYIQPGTILVESTAHQYLNRAYFFGPNYTYGYQDKLNLVEFEKDSSLLVPGAEQTLFETSFGKMGIAICYDSEFPEVVRRLVHAGALLILVPSYTVTLAGYHRVHLCNRARAIENQCYMITSHAVGRAHLSEPCEHTFGKNAVLGPADQGFPDNGIIAEGPMNEISILTANLDFEKIEFIREHGNTRNFADAVPTLHDFYIQQKIKTLKIF